MEESRNAKDIALVQAAAKENATAKENTIPTPADELPALKVASGGVVVNVSPRSVTTHVASPTGTITPTTSQKPTTKTTTTTTTTTTTAPPLPPSTATQQPVKSVESNLPEPLLCCLSKQLMVDPVMTCPDGMTYERVVIEAYIAKETAAKRPLLSPVTGEPILHPSQVPLMSNFAIKNEIAQWKTTNNVSD